MLYFVSDYMEGAHPSILKRMTEINMEKNSGYGRDPYSESAKEKIRKECKIDDAEIYFLIGGTQTNETIISSVLRPYEGVIAADTGHIATHEAGAIEHGGHKVITLKGHDGKISAEDVANYMTFFEKDLNNEHEVAPGMIYISNPTEYGTLYSHDDLRKLRETADKYGLKIFLDGARLGYALAADESLTIADIASLVDVFYIGGTKVGALFGEAVVFPKPGLVPHFYTITKQHGAMLAKGWLLGLQFDALFTDGIYKDISANAIKMARKIRKALLEKGYELYIDSPTNQIFPIVTEEQAAEFDKNAKYGFMETLPDGRMVIRFCTSWATKEEDTDKLIELL
ncbi:threonine aldolase family protein [Lachnospiraceae bacterium C1.1]|nr:aminotransferase class I/II-fold pyridoxal phosphate-dependent enzyme [Lachnospiraceae bacterium C1.1]